MDEERRVRVVAAALLVLVAGYAALGARAVGEWLYGAAQVVALGALVVGVVGRGRRAPVEWWLILGGALLWGIGDTIVATTTSGFSQVSAADAFYVGEYVLYGVAIARFLRAATRDRDLDAVLDVLAVLAIGVYAVWELVVEPSLGHPVPGTARVLATAYPLLDAVLLVMLLRVLLVPGYRSRSITLLTAAVAFAMAADITNSVLVQRGAAADANPTVLGLAWLLAMSCVGLAALDPTMMHIRDAPEEAERSTSRLRMVFAALALASPMPIAAVSWAIEGELEPGHYLAVTTVVTAIGIVRFVRLHAASERANADLLRRQTYFRKVVQRSSDGLVVLDAEGRVRDASPAVAGVLGIAEEDIVGRRSLDVVHRDDKRHVITAWLGLVDEPGAHGTSEVRLRRGDGTWGWYEARWTNLLRDDVVGGVVLNLHDVSDRKRMEADLLRQAFHDPLTGLANRALLHDRADRALARIARRGSEVALLFCDLDGFKTVNDSLGHGAGDRLLRLVAERIVRVVRAEDTVARLGGDEFAVLVEGPDAGARADDIAARLLATLAEPVEVLGTSVVPGISIGVASSASGAVSAEELLRDADIAMYTAKAAGKGHAARFREGMRTEILERLALQADLRAAVERDELDLRLRPLVVLGDDRVSGYEAAVRWLHPTRGFLRASQFVPLAEESGDIVAIGKWVLEQACAIAAAWPDRTRSVAVHVSGRELRDPGYVERVDAALRAAGLEASRLVLTMMESTVVADPRGVAAAVERLKRVGVRIGIDDFGRATSSLRRLGHVSIDVLKVDREIFGSDTPVTAAPEALLDGLVELGRMLGIELVADDVGALERVTTPPVGVGSVPAWPTTYRRSGPSVS